MSVTEKRKVYFLLYVFIQPRVVWNGAVTSSVQLNLTHMTFFLCTFTVFNVPMFIRSHWGEIGRHGLGGEHFCFGETEVGPIEHTNKERHQSEMGRRIHVVSTKYFPVLDKNMKFNDRSNFDRLWFCKILINRLQINQFSNDPLFFHFITYNEPTRVSLFVPSLFDNKFRTRVQAKCFPNL